MVLSTGVQTRGGRLQLLEEAEVSVHLLKIPGGLSLPGTVVAEPRPGWDAKAPGSSSPGAFFLPAAYVSAVIITSVQVAL